MVRLLYLEWRAAGDRRSGIVGFSRFLANPRVTVGALLDGWGAELSQGCASRHIPAIQDTSEFNFTTTKERSRGLGEIGKGSGRGVLLHAMLGVDAETGGILGLTTGRMWTRDGRVSVHHRNRPLPEKEWSCHGYVPVSQLIYAAFRSNAKGLLPPSDEWRRRGL
jgi:hypothetical protein